MMMDELDFSSTAARTKKTEGARLRILPFVIVLVILIGAAVLSAWVGVPDSGVLGVDPIYVGP